MAIEQPLIIGYSGSLAFSNGVPLQVKSGLKDYLWTYNHNSTDSSTRSPFFLFKAVQLAKEKYGITSAQLQIHLWGKIDMRNQALAKSLGIQDFVKISGYLPKDESVKKNQSCDVLFLPMESSTQLGNPLFIPGKAFEYLQAGKPILALSGACDAMDILQPSGLLTQFSPGDSEKIAKWLVDVIENRGLLKQYIPNSAYIEQYSFKEITGKLARVFDELLNK